MSEGEVPIRQEPDGQFVYGETTPGEERQVYESTEWVVVAGRNPQRLHIPENPHADDRDDTAIACDGHFGGTETQRRRRVPVTAYPFDEDDGPYYPFCIKCMMVWRSGVVRL